MILSTILSRPDTDEILARNLREQREARGWTLVELATRSGVSRAMVSKIERGEASPTAAPWLGRLSAAFGLTLSQLFARIEDQPGAQVIRAAEQLVWRDPETGFLRRSLTPSGQSPLELVWGELPPGARISYPSASEFIADQQLVVIGGELSITLGGIVHALGAGDCLRFGSPADVTFHNSGAARSRYVIAVLRQTRMA